MIDLWHSLSMVAVSWLDYMHTKATETQGKPESNTKEGDFRKMWQDECANLCELLKMPDHFQAAVVSTLLDTETSGDSQGMH